MSALPACLLLLTALAAAPCSGGEAPREGTMTLKVGEAVELPQGKGTLTLDSVDDSRCPAGVVCAWAGDAVAHLTARGGGEPEAVTLSLQARDKPVTVRGVQLRLSGMEPYPQHGKTLDPEFYRAAVEWILP
jgi:hypothetical protein